MTALQRFLAQTEQVSQPRLRRAMAQALATEKPRSSDAFARFYDRVMEELHGINDQDPAQSPAPTMTLGIGGVHPCWC